MDQARQRAERRARKHPLRQRFSSARVYILVILPSDGKRGGKGVTGEPGLRARYRCRTRNAASPWTSTGQVGGGAL